LILLENYAREASRETGVEIEVLRIRYRQGPARTVRLSRPPYQWRLDFSEWMGKTLSRLRGARLVLGDIKETSRYHFSRNTTRAAATALHDLDFYSSTGDP